MASFYKRFGRDYLRYKDTIQCIAHKLVEAIRKDSLTIGSGEYYALHIRRGDLQFKEVKIGADQMLRNLHHANGTTIIPPGAFVSPSSISILAHVTRRYTSRRTTRMAGAQDARMKKGISVLTSNLHCQKDAWKM